jgi:hypothetical protein
MDNIYVGRLMALAKHLILLCVAIAGAAVAAPRAAQAQDSVPAGTVLPMRLDTPLSSRKSRPGEVITGRIMQDVPLESGLLIRSGARITGHVLDVSSAATGGHAKISLVFDAIKLHRSAIPVTTNLRALASPLEIDDAQLPLYGGDRGTPSTAYTTVQVGGEVVYRGGGPVAHGEAAVGVPVPGGVLVALRAAEAKPCRGSIDGNNQPQALWLFSSDACGVYGYAQVEITHAGRTKPVGQIVLSSTDGRDLIVRAGSGMLLRVNAR